MMARIGATRNTRTRAQNNRKAKTWRRWLRKPAYGDLVMAGPSSQAHALGTDEALVNTVEHQCRYQKYCAEGRGHAPVDRIGGVERDEIADHLIGGAANQGRGDVVPQGQNKDEQAAGTDPRQGQRQV